MRIVFFGTPDYILPILETLHKSLKKPKIESGVVGVVTQPPKPTGRKQKLEYCPVDTWAYKKRIPIFHSSEAYFKSSVMTDIGVLAAYGEIIPKYVIDHFKFGILNIHPSILPNWRGASPVQASIINGDEITGVTIIKLDEKLDHGPIISQIKEKILDNDTTESLRKRLFERSGDVITSLLPAYLKGKIKPRPQEHSKATFTTQVKKDDAFIEPKIINASLKGQTLKTKWEIRFMKTKYSQASLIKNYTLYPDPYTLERFIRAMNPWPIAWSRIRISGKQDARRLKILKAHIGERQDARRKTQDEKSYHVSRITYLALDQVQLEGKNPVSWKQFKEAYKTAIFE